MAYHLHVTPAVVLALAPRGEANQMVTLFTRELGLVRAFARSSRVERSKLRGLLQQFTVGAVSCVRGKEYWRLVGMAETTSLYVALKEDPASLGILLRLSALLGRLMHGEERHPALYDLFLATAEALQGNISDEEGKAIEALAAGRILERLGHMPREPFVSLLENDRYDPALLKEASLCRLKLVRAVNAALRESGF